MGDSASWLTDMEDSDVEEVEQPFDPPGLVGIGNDRTAGPLQGFPRTIVDALFEGFNKPAPIAEVSDLVVSSCISMYQRRATVCMRETHRIQNELKQELATLELAPVILLVRNHGRGKIKKLDDLFLQQQKLLEDLYHLEGALELMWERKTKKLSSNYGVTSLLAAIFLGLFVTAPSELARNTSLGALPWKLAFTGVTSPLTAMIIISVFKTLLPLGIRLYSPVVCGIIIKARAEILQEADLGALSSARYRFLEWATLCTVDFSDKTPTSTPDIVERTWPRLMSILGVRRHLVRSVSAVWGLMWPRGIAGREH
ncbi:hypothetical protein MFIFM68171_09970 [Madurella fahalii]|uniref:Uncharacterized protein n=1 Tax=Madurella fahalii TaxID=1157608 RepID=A0ABQ0GPU6_9PEZI